MTALSLGDPGVRQRFDTFADLYVPPTEKEVEGAGIFDVARAAYEIFNTIGSTGILIDSMGHIGEPDPRFQVFSVQDPTKPWHIDSNPYLHIRGYEVFADLFLRARNPHEVTRIKRRIDREQDNRRILFEERPILGAVASMAAGILDPLIFIPTAKVAVTARGVSTARTSLRFAATGAGVIGVQEAILHQQQLTKPPEEIALSIGAGAILAGMLGGAIGRMTGKQFAKAEKALILAMENPETLGPNSIPVKKGRLTSYKDFEQAADIKIAKGGQRLARMWKFFAPRTANYASESPVTRRIANDLHMSNLVMEGEKALDAEIVTELARNRLRVTEQKLRKLYVKYRRSTPDSVPEEKWFEKVAEAMEGEVAPDGSIIRVNEHEIPSVAAAARLYSEETFTPLAQKAVDMGLMPQEIFDRPGYLTRLANGDRLRQPGEVEKFIQANVDHRVKVALAEDPTADLAKVVKAAEAEAKGVADLWRRTPEGRIFPGDVPLRGPLLERTFDTPNPVIAPWLVRNMDRIAKYYVRAMASDLALSEKFGLVRFRPQLDGSREAVVASMRRAASKAKDPDKAGRQAAKILNTRDSQVTDKIDSLRLRRAFGKARPGLAKRIINADTDAQAVKLLKDRDDALVIEFSTGNMRLALDEIDAYYRRRIRTAEKTDKAEALRLRAARKSDLANIRHMRDEVRGMLQMPADPTTLSGKTARTLRVARQMTVMSTGGLIVIAQMVDASLQMMEFGLTRVFRSSFLPFVTDLNRVKLTLAEARLALGPSEIATGRRAMRLYDIEDEFATRTVFERGVNRMVYLFSLANLMTPWNAAIRNMSSLATNGMVIETAIKVRAGRIRTRTDQADLRRVLEVVKDEAMLVRIAEQFERPGVGDSRFTYAPNTTAWNDPGAVTAMQAALKRVDDFVLIKGGPGDRPRVGPGLPGEVMRTFALYRNFGLSSMTRVLGRAMQYRDARVLSGILSSFAIAMIAMKIKDTIRGRDKERTPMQWIGRAWERSAFSGFIFDGDQVLDSVTGGNFALSRLFGISGETRYFSPRDVYSAIFGPVVGQGVDLASGLGGFADLDPEPRDIDRLRRLIPLQNHFLLQAILTQMGVEPLEPLRRAVRQ